MIDLVDCPDERDGATGSPTEEGAPAWMVTFGDLMSLLLTFFILLFSMSELKMERFLLASQSVREAVGGTAVEAPDEPTGLMPDPVDPELELQNPGRSEVATPPATVEVASDSTAVEWSEEFVESYLVMHARILEQFVDEHGLAPEVRVERAPEGVYLRMETAALFAPGDAAVRAEARAILAALADITRTLEVGVTVTGHADDRPIHTARYASNWELSAARAAGVARHLVEAGQTPERTRVESYGQYRPAASNDTPEGRARNRRVDLFFARSDVEDAAARLEALGAERARERERGEPGNA